MVLMWKVSFVFTMLHVIAVSKMLALIFFYKLLIKIQMSYVSND